MRRALNARADARGGTAVLVPPSVAGKLRGRGFPAVAPCCCAEVSPSGRRHLNVGHDDATASGRCLARHQANAHGAVRAALATRALGP